MSTAQDLLNSYLSPAATSDVAPAPVANSAPVPTDPAPNTAERLMNQIPSLAQQKQASVVEKSADKKVSIGGPQPTTAANVTEDQLYSANLAAYTGAGLKTMPSDVEQDAATLPDIQLYMKYGDQAQSLISRRNAADQSLLRDKISSRSTTEALGDSALGVGMGIGNSLGGLAALGAGIVNNDAGVAVSTAVDKANKYVQQNLESDALQAHQKVNSSENELGYRDNKAQQEIDAKTDGSFLAGLKRIGRDATTAVSNAASDRMTLSDGSAQAIGSLLSAGPLGKVIGVGAKAAVGGAEGLGLIGESTAAKLLSHAAEASTSAAIGVTEAGGAYQQTSAQIMDQSNEDLRKSSPAYVDLVDNQKMDPEEAKKTIASRAGLLAAAIQGPAALVTGKLVSKFEAHPFSVPSLREVGQNILKEGVEETLQSGTGQLAQNIGTQQYADKNQDLLDGVGEQAGLGGLYGSLSAAQVQAPGALFRSTTKAALAAGGAVKNVLAPAVSAVGRAAASAATARGASVAAANEAASPVADETVATAATEAAQNAPQAATQAQDAVQESDLDDKGKASVSEYVQSLQDSIKFDPKDPEEGLDTAPKAVQDAVGDATSRVGSLQNMAKYLSDDSVSRADRASVLPVFEAFMAHFRDLVNEQPEELSKLPADHPARQFADDINSLYSSVTQTPGVQKAQAAREELIKSAPVIHEDSSDADVQHAVSVAEVAPERMQEGSADAILKMASAGRIQINTAQKAALETARALINGRKDYVAQLEKSGQTSPQDFVAKQISANQGSEQGRESALEHANTVRAAYVRGDFKGARAALNNFGKFTQSLQNKLAAVNTQIATHGRDSNVGNSAFYNTVSPDKSKWIRSAKTFGITPTSANSVRISQQVAAEAHALTGIHNALASAYPELKVQHIGQVALHPSLANGSPEQVSAEWKEGKRGGVEDTSAESQEQSNTEQPSQEDHVANSVEESVPAETRDDDATTDSAKTSNETQIEEAKTAEVTPVQVDNTETVEAPVAKSEPVKKGIAAVYPDLAQSKSGNRFEKSFLFPEKLISNLAGMEAPLDHVRQSLSSQQDFTQNGKGTAMRLTDDVIKSYRRILGWVPHLVDDFNDHMQAFLDKTPKKGKQAGISNADALESGKFEPNRYRNGKLLNLAEKQEDGSYKLNQPLMETASVAGLQWFLSSNHLSTIIDEKDAANIFGVRTDNPNMDTLVQFLNSGISRIDAVSSLAQKIKGYWGLETNLNAPAGYTDGIPQAMAAEILVSMKNRNVQWTDPNTGEKRSVPLLVEDQLRVDTKTGEIIPNGEKSSSKNIKTVSVLTPTYFDGIEDLQKFPDAIERVVAKTPDLNHYFDGERPPVAKTQMRNPSVNNTQEQQDMIANEQDTPHKVNQNMALLYAALDTEHLVNIFGPGEIDEDTMNVNDANSKKGQRLSVTAAYQTFLETMEAVQAHATATGKDAGDVELRFGYNVSRVGRLQMLGRYNPQASKLMREVVLPTESTLDLTKRDHAAAYMLAMGQALGVKVHNMQFGAMAAKTQGLIDGQFAPAIKQLMEFQKTGKIDGDKLKDNLGDAPTFAMLHALMDYARYQSVEDNAGLKKFKTQLYLEADGMTNGPINAMALLSRGAFDPSWVQNMSRGGLYFGGTEDQNSTVQREKDPIDLYKATSDDLRDRLRDMRQNMDANSPVKAQQTHLLNLMSLLLGKDVMFDGQDNVELDRGIAKNPLTITIYGSGASGIAGNLTDQLVQKIYQQFSNTIHDGRSIQTLFGIDDEAKAKFKVFSEAMTALRSQVVTVDKEGNFAIEDTGYTPKSRDLKTYTFSADELKSIRQNMLSLFVQPMRESIENVVGKSLFDSADMVRKATQVQSIMQQYAFQQAVQDRLEWKAKNDPDYVPGEFLSQKEQNDILKSLAYLSPTINAPGQTFYVSGSQNAALNDNAGYAEAFDGTMETPASVYGPADAGVAGIPFLNIGMGDAKATQIQTTMAKSIPGKLWVFDGMHMPLDKIVEGSKQANQAVMQSWMGNPLQVVNDSYQSFLKDMSLKGIAYGSEQHADLVHALFGLSENVKSHSIAKVEAAMNLLGNSLTQGAMEAQARHNTINRVNVSVDQMAAAASPFQVKNRTSITGSNEEVANGLNQVYQEELGKLSTKSSDDELIGKELRSVGRAHASGSRVLSYTSIGQLAKMLKMKIPAAQLQLLASIQKSTAAKGYKTIIGTREQLIAYNNAQGANALDNSLFLDRNNKGFMSPGRQEIYLMNPTSETLVHELIHAATFNTVQDYYDGKNLGDNHEVLAGAVQNIEKLMNQFLGMDGKVEGSPGLTQAYADASTTIKANLGDTNLNESQRKAQGLNEFMAWALANSDLNRQLSRVQAHPLVQLAKDAFAAIKALIWGRKKAPVMPGDDMLSNLQFNTQVILQGQPSMGKMMRDTTLFQTSSYGTSDRLQQIDNAFDRKITDYITTGDYLSRSRRATQAVDAHHIGVQVMSMFAQAFPMNMQEKTTFQKVVYALGTEADLDPNSLSRMQQLWSQVTKALTVEMLEDPNERDPNQKRYDGQAKYDAVIGNNLTMIDPKGRSSLLPGFFALAVTNDQFREALSKMDIPKALKSNAESSVDRVLENTANALMDSLSARISGEGKADNVLKAMDALTNRMTEVAQDRQAYLDQFLNTSGGLVDIGNQYLINAMDKLSQSLVNKAEAVDAKYNNKTTNFLASAARLTGAIVNENQAGKVGEGILSWVNGIEGKKPFTEFLGDLVGRIDSNANVYDMIKTVRAWVAQTRQQFREVVPNTIAEQFSRKLTDEEWTTLHSMGTSDIASLAQGMNQADILKVLGKPAELKSRVSSLEAAIKAEDPANWNLYQKKMQQLADYMMTKRTSSNLLRNAESISRLFNEKAKKMPTKSTDFVKNIDMLTTLYALEHIGIKDRISLSTLVDKEPKGMSFALSYLQGQRLDEMTRAGQTDRALLNHFKGNIPSIQQAGASLIIADDKEYANLTERSYIRVADYKGSSAEVGRAKRGYYYAPVTGRNVFNQGILQNVRQTAGGVDQATGYSIDNPAGRITNGKDVSRMQAAIIAGTETGTEHLMPVYNENGQIIALERSVDPTQMARLQYNTNLSEMIGVWRGRQVEEAQSAMFNDHLVDNLSDMYTKDIADDPQNQKNYINVLDPREQAKDPVLADAMKLLTWQMRQRIEQSFGDNFYVRRDMLNDALGYRSASVGDAWTGTSRWSDDAQNNMKRLAMSIAGNQAYRYAVNAEKFAQNFIGDVKTLIVVKSIVVPVANIVANGYQLVARGVPIKNIITGMPKKTAEVQAYVESEVRRIKADAELRAAEGSNDIVAQRKLKAEIQSIEDAHRRLSIYPLIQAGELSSISDGQATAEEIELTSGKMHSYIEGLVDKLPEGFKTAGRYALITKDTALFQGMQKAMEYGDFLAKALLYDDLTKRQGKSSEYALSRVTEEYVNYDRLPGRFRGYMESMGLLWFYNFKIRSAKIALSMIRNNPVHALLATLAPNPPLLGSIGTPLTDNIFTKLADGQMNFSLGFGQIFHAPMLNPWVNLVH